jgi:uncharacterized protein (UPF0548 family)
MAKGWSCGWHTDAMFSFKRPTAAEIEGRIAAAHAEPPFKSFYLLMEGGWKVEEIPFGFAHDKTRSRLGSGERIFVSAKRAFDCWAQFDLGWVRVANPSATMTVGEIIAVETESLGLWALNLSRIVERIDSESLFGFIYSTTAFHIEQGEERFLLRFDDATGDTWYELESVSRPRSGLARIGHPITRSFQHKFARDSHRRMASEIEKT